MKKGMTMLMDVKNANLEALTKHDIVAHYLIRCTEEIGMRPLPHTLTIEHFPLIDGGGEFGVSGMLILVESHIALHTWPELKYARVEISSCKEFEPEIALCVTKAFFGGEIDWKVVEWGAE